MRCPNLSELLPPPGGKTGWPWTEESRPLPEKMPDGQPWPKISIVTPSYNQGRYIEETIRSILLQGYPNLEYVIIDGGSSDDSVEIIKKYSQWLTYWVSEPDRGQSHAINKGLARCGGDILNWINSDDLLCPGALQAIADAWRKTPNSIIAGCAVIVNQDGTEVIVKPHGITIEHFINIKKAREDSWDWRQTSTYLPLAGVKSVGGVVEDLQFTMDHFLMIELLQKCGVVYVPEVLGRFRLHDKSKTVSCGWYHFLLEIMKTLRASNGLAKYVSAKEMKEQEVYILITCTTLAAGKGLYGLAFKHVKEAVLISPRLVIRELLQRGILRHVLRKLGRTFRIMPSSQQDR